LQNAKKVELGDQPFGDVLWDLFGELSLMEIFFLYQEIESHLELKGKVAWAIYFQKQKRFYNDKVEKLFKALTLASSDFLTWCDSKKMENKDLYPLCSLKEEGHQALFTQLSSFFPEQNLSRSEGREALDLLVDLILMNKNFEDLKPSPTANWVSRLKQMRNPNTTRKDQSPTTINQAWPQFVKVKKQRQGDRVIHQMEIQFLNQADLESKLSRLKPQGPKQ
jgi:hypothetical protein